MTIEAGSIEAGSIETGMRETGRAPHFETGAAVRVNDHDRPGHCRAPRFVRGHSGTIVGAHGIFHDPERLAYHQPGLPALPLYKVRFRQTDLWPEYAGSSHDTLEVDVYEPWLSPA